MLAVLEDIRSGEVASFEVPQPELRPGGVLVRTEFSAISAGTERAKLETGEKSLIGKAMARPDLVQQVLDYARKNGVKAAYQKVMARLDSLSAMGYSCSGVVIETAPDVGEFRPGDRVACAGAGYANHCAVNFVPQNLVVRVPDEVSLEAASLTTIGAIAMQGLRQAQVSFGETVVIIGAGLVGVLAVQLANAAGCRVIAIDLDASRVQRAVRFGAALGLVASDPALLTSVKEFSGHGGADAAVITAASRSSEPLELAAKLLRDRGRIVVVGDVKIDVPRGQLYAKELSLSLSRSYGPGRYDPQYEEGGVDYPIGYVRWTEKRNMEAFLQLAAAGALDLAPLVEHCYAAADATRAYAEVRAGKVYTCILRYPESEEAMPAVAFSRGQGAPAIEGQVRLGCIGAGGFARDMIFPNLRKNNRVVLESVATASGTSAESARRSFGFARAQCPTDLLRDSGIDAVFIVSQHESHAEYVLAAIHQQKRVFVEKPLAINRDQLQAISALYEAEFNAGRAPFLMVGFNRRFAPFSEQIRTFFASRREPMMVQVRINAGFLPREHWTQRPEGGGRIVGELCHFVDWARSIVSAPIETVSATALPDGSRYNRDNVVATLNFADGSVANLTYLANGDSSVPKEHMEVFCQASVACLNDFCELELARNGQVRRNRSARDKGHNREMELTVKAMRQGLPSPISFGELYEVTETTFAISDAIACGRPVPVKRLEIVLASSQTTDARA